MNDVLSGIWTYRSFRNAGEAVDDFNKLKVWEAELFLHCIEGTNRLQGHLGERPAVVKGGEPFLNVIGEVVPGTPDRVRWRATGQPGTDFAGWIYDYEAVINPLWAEGKGQRATLVGTVARTVAHGSAPAGAVFSFIAVKRDFVEPRVRIPLPAQAVSLLASPEHRLHHQLWHGSRDNWPTLSAAQKDELRKLGWQPGPENGERNARGAGWITNGAGEDFLFMHREMILQVRAIENIGSWARVPSPPPLVSYQPGFEAAHVGNPDGFAIPPAWTVPGDPGMTSWLFELRKTSTLYARFQAWEAQYTDPTYLSRITLGELGARMEWTIHNWMHMRWASAPRDPATGEFVAEGRGVLDFAEKWFRPEYDYLGETFSSHVNPVFWRLHGWVDDRIEDWFRAHEAAHKGEVKQLNVLGVPWFAPGKWVVVSEPWSGRQKAPAHHDHTTADGQAGAHGGGHGGVQRGGHGNLDLDVDVMKRALSVIFAPPSAAAASKTLSEQFSRDSSATWFKPSAEE